MLVKFKTSDGHVAIDSQDIRKVWIIGHQIKIQQYSSGYEKVVGDIDEILTAINQAKMLSNPRVPFSDRPDLQNGSNLSSMIPYVVLGAATLGALGSDSK